MNVITVTPRNNTLEAFQVDFDLSAMDEIVDYLNTNFHDHVYVRNDRWIEKQNRDGIVEEFLVMGDWVVTNFGRTWFMSNADFNNTYKRVI